MPQLTTTGVLHRPLRVGGTAEVRNRLYRAPVLEGAGDGPDCVERYAKTFVPNAEAGVADMVGIGRAFYSEPDLPRRVLAGSPAAGRCQFSNLCVPAQMLGMKGVCYNPAVIRTVRSARQDPRTGEEAS